jgi:hypothetical protein
MVGHGYATSVARPWVGTPTCYDRFKLAELSIASRPPFSHGNSTLGCNRPIMRYLFIIAKFLKFFIITT